MNNIEHNLHEARDIHLSPDERGVMRRTLELFMQEHPPTGGLRHRLTSVTRNYKLTIMYVSLIIVLLGTSYMAKLFLDSPERQMEEGISQAEQQMQQDEQLAADLGW